jgi:predicted permease
MLDTIRQDVRTSLRALRKRPGFALLAICTLSLGVGGTAALFSVANSPLLRPLPYPEDEHLVAFWSTYDWRGVEFDYIKDRPGIYEDIAAYTSTAVTMRGDGPGGGPAVLVEALAVSSEFFPSLGIGPALGRVFVAGEDRPGAEPVAVLSHGLWQRELGGDPEIVGKTLILDGAPRRVVGVMPQGFFFPSPEVRMWIPLLLDPASSGYQGNGYLVLIGRHAAGVGPQRAGLDLDLMATQLGERFTYPEAWDKTRNPQLTPIREFLLGDVRPALVLLLGAVAFILLMAVTNVAALVLGRVSDRRHEMGVRTALGATRGRVARQVVTESIVLGLVSGVVGVTLAVVAFRLLVNLLPLGAGFAGSLSLDWSLLWTSLGLALLVGILVGLAPMHAILRGELKDVLPRDRQEGGGGGRGRGLQTGFVVLEVVLAVMLVAGAGLLIRSVSSLNALDTGVDPEGVLTMELFAGPGDLGEAERAAFLDEVVTEVSAIAGVRSAAVVHRLPLRDDGSQGPATIEDRPDLQGTRRPNSYVRFVTPGYFETIGLELRRGRTFTTADRADGLPVVVVSETLAERFWQGEDPVGRRIRTTFDRDWVTVVGVVEDVRISGLRGPIPPVAYRPYGQAAFIPQANMLVVRAEVDPATLAGPVRAEVQNLDSRVAVSRVSTMEGVIRQSIAASLRLRFLLTLFSGLALLLGVLGVYGVLSNSVRRRYREFGIRMALGATPRNVVAGVIWRGLAMTGAGVAIGLAGAFLLGRAFESLLFGIDPADPTVFVGASLVLGGAGLLAAWLPARRASRVDPMVTLRAE